MRGNATSQSFSSHAGRLWANQQLPHVPNNADRDTIRLLADNFDGTGFCSRSVRNLCADGGNHRGRGAMLRSLNTLEHLGRIVIGRRGGGSHLRTMTFQAVGWGHSRPFNVTQRESRDEVSQPALGTPPESSRDSPRHTVRTHRESDSLTGIDRPETDSPPAGAE
jgi:hypothetical protein